MIRKLNKLMGLELTSFFSFCLDRMLCSTTAVAALQKNIGKNLANAQHDPRQTILIYSLMIIELLDESIFDFFLKLGTFINFLLVWQSGSYGLYRHSLISAFSISTIFDLMRFIILSYFPPL